MIRSILTLIATSLVLFSCADLQEKLQLMMKISKDLSGRFEHQQIHTSFGFGTEAESNYLSVTFLDFPIQNAEEAELEDVSARVSDYLFAKYPELNDLSYIEVRFTDEVDIDNMQNFYSYKTEKGSSPQNRNEETEEQM